MRRRVQAPVIDPRQAELPIERAMAGAVDADEIGCELERVTRVLVFAWAIGARHGGLAAAIMEAERAIGSALSPALREFARGHFHAQGYAVDRDEQTISAIVPAVPRGTMEVRARVEWRNAYLVAEHHDGAVRDRGEQRNVFRDREGYAVYIYPHPPAATLVRGHWSCDTPQRASAREFLIAAIDRGTITRSNPHPREDTHGQERRSK